VNDDSAPTRPVVLSARPETGGASALGSSLAIGNCPAQGSGEVAPLHVHYADDEAWFVVSGTLRFRFVDGEVVVAQTGQTVFVPAGVAHTFGNAGPDPSRFLIIMTARLEEMIRRLHEVDRSQHDALYREYQSELLE